MIHESIITGEVHSQHITGDLVNSIRKNASKHGIVWLGGIPITDGEPLQPRINHGRWIVDCPFCPSAELMNESGLFMCQSCWNINNGRAYHNVAKPNNRIKVERALLKRPEQENRNWKPGETVAQLLAENIEHGVE